MLLRAALRNVVIPIQILIEYSPSPSEAVHEEVNQALEMVSSPSNQLQLASITMEVQRDSLLADVKVTCNPAMALVKVEETKEALSAMLNANTKIGNVKYRVRV